MALDDEQETQAESPQIVCNGSERAISSNLLEGMAQLLIIHAMEFDEWLWVDVSCIEQENLAEKGQQIELMRKIFSRAEEVLIWLGPATDPEFVKRVVDLIKNLEPALTKHMNKDDGRLPPMLRPAALGCGTLGKMAGIEQLADKFAAFLVFCGTCRYFHRCWTIQELILATHKRIFGDLMS